MLTLTLPPPLNDLYRPNWHGKGVRKTDECKDWELEAQQACRAQGLAMIPGHLRLRMTLDLYYATERDIDSSLKATLDCLQGFVYENDRQIVELNVRKFKDNSAPRLEIDLFEATGT